MTATHPKKRAAKRQRQKREDESTVNQTDRDIEVETLAGLTSYLTSQQIARELFPSLDRARRRLRQLYDSGYLNVVLSGSNQPNLVTLTAKGKAAVVERCPELAGRLRVVRQIHQAAVEHHLGVVDCRLYAADLGVQCQTPLLAWDNAGGSLQRQLGLFQHGLKPDGLAEFARSQHGSRDSDRGSWFVCVEFDCGTEPLSVLRKKAERYLAVACEGQVDSLWLVAKARPSRQRRIAGLLREQGLEQWARLIPHEHTLIRPAQKPPKVHEKSGEPARAGGQRADRP